MRRRVQHATDDEDDKVLSCGGMGQAGPAGSLEGTEGLKLTR